MIQLFESETLKGGTEERMNNIKTMTVIGHVNIMKFRDFMNWESGINTVD